MLDATARYRKFALIVMLIFDTLMHHAEVLLVCSRARGVLELDAGSIVGLTNIACSSLAIVLTRVHLAYSIISRKVVLLVLQNGRQVGILVNYRVSSLLGR